LIGNPFCVRVTTFTKEQFIAETSGNLEVLKGYESRHPGGELLLLNIRLAEIALAALEAEPVGG